MGPEERVRQLAVEYIGDVALPQIQEQVAEAVTVIPQEHFSCCASLGSIANESITSFDLENPIYSSFGNTRVLSSAGMAGRRNLRDDL